MRIDDRLTPSTPSEVLASLGAAWRVRFAEEPSRDSLLVILSQWALETGRGHAMHCFNVGNLKSDGVAGDWTFFACDEILNGKVVWFHPDDPACCFRAYATLDEGASDYLTTLVTRFSAAWPAVLAGDPAEFAHLLKVAHYYTASETVYTRSLVALFAEFDRTTPPVHPGPDLHTVKGQQQALAILGFNPGALDGVLGPNTAAAARHFQSSVGLVADGIIGPLTISAFARALARMRGGLGPVALDLSDDSLDDA